MTIGRPLNDYEGMLATATCNVAFSFSVQKGSESVSISERLTTAWNQCRSSYHLLQVRLEPLEGDMGPLGPRYKAVSMEENDEQELFCIIEKGESEDIVAYLQKIGTTKLDVFKGSFWIEFHVCSNGRVQAYLSLSHALSDGPGALQVVHSFLQHLSEASHSATMPIQQPLHDLQAMVLGRDYGKSRESKDFVFDLLQEYQLSLQNDAKSVLPPEAIQGIPSEDGTDGVIHCIERILSEDETLRLLEVCRANNSTIQGALSAACLRARASLLQFSTPLPAVVQVPMNARRLVVGGKDVSTACLCGSAGLLHTAEVKHQEDAATALQLAQACTERMRNAMKNNGEQPKEWLSRLMRSPATLPPSSLMASSIGVAPVLSSYPSVEVHECHFFGGTLQTDPHQQATMSHAITFAGKLQVMFNATWPGVSRSFLEQTADWVKADLKRMAQPNSPTKR